MDIVARATVSDAKRRANRAYYMRNQEHTRAKMREWYRKNKEGVRSTSLAWRIANVDRIMLKDAEKRAKRFGLAFDLAPWDIHVPEFCPVLGIPLRYGVGKRTDNSPSLDRIRPELGYVHDNVCVISWRANDLKADANVEELRMVLAWMEKQ